MVRIARQAGLGPCTSYLEFGTALNQKGKNNMVLSPVAAACISHVPAFSTMPKVRAAFLSYFPGGMQAAPEWSSDSGLAASALLERELTARFVGGAFTTATGRTMTASAADMLAALALIHQLLGVRSPFGGAAPGGLDAALAKGSTSSTDSRERLSPSDVSVSAILSQ